MVWVVSLSAMDLIIHSLTAIYIIQHSEFVRVW